MRRSPPLVSQPSPAPLGLGRSSAPSTSLQNFRARSGSSAGNSISGEDMRCPFQAADEETGRRQGVNVNRAHAEPTPAEPPLLVQSGGSRVLRATLRSASARRRIRRGAALYGGFGGLGAVASAIQIVRRTLNG